MAPTLVSGVTPVELENVTFPATVKPPGSSNTFFLGGAGVRGLQIQDKFIKFTAIGIYLQDHSLPFLAAKWKGNTPHRLTHSDDFFREIVTGPFEKFMQVTMILPLTGQQYSEKVAENCVDILKSFGTYTDEEARAIEKFVSVFKDETFPPGSTIFAVVSSKGSLAISLSKDGSIPEVGTAVIENKHLSEAMLESMIGKNGVSPAAKQSLATRLSELFKEGVDANLYNKEYESFALKTKQEETKQEKTKLEEIKQDETKHEESKKEEETKHEESKKEDTKQEEAKKEETKQESYP